MRIWKWPIEVTDRQTVMMPKGAKLLDVQMQGGECCAWALCDQNAEKEPRHLAIYGTGKPMPDEPGEDFCDVWAECKCGHEPGPLDAFEDVWGGCHDENVMAAISCWNDAMSAHDG